MPIVRLKDNHRMQISLRYPSPREQRKGGQIEFLYTLHDGAALFVPPVAHAEIQALHVGSGEPFWISKVIGTGGAAVWSVERIASTIVDKGAVVNDHRHPKPVTSARSISAAPVAPPPNLTTRESIRIFNQLVATIQAVDAAEKFSVTIGRPVTFSSEDIRAMGISGFIEQSRRAA